VIDLSELFTMFWAFFRIGGLTFGGGYAMLPMLTKEAVEKYGWCTQEELLDYYTVGQCVPGIIATNTATFIGYRKRGFLGALFCIAGVVAPSLIIIMCIAAFIQNLAGNAMMAHAFNGIRVAVTVLVGDAIYKLWKKSIIDKFTMAIFLVTLVIQLFVDVSPILIIVVAGLSGYLAKKFIKKGEKA